MVVNALGYAQVWPLMEMCLQQLASWTMLSLIEMKVMSKMMQRRKDGMQAFVVFAFVVSEFTEN